MLDEKDSDCGTNKAIPFTLTEDNIKLFMNRYIVDKNNELVLLTDDNKSKYIDKKVKIRSPMYCIGDKICNKCAGELYYKLGINNIGIMCEVASGVLMNRSMKAFHDSSIRMTEIDVDSYISPIK